MSGAWTPGPWRAHREKNGVSSLRGADGTPIIEVDCLELGREVSPDVWFETTPADLALMAAAPDLLEATEAVVNELDWEYLIDGDKVRERWMRHFQLYQAAMAAIAKAKGETL